MKNNDKNIYLDYAATTPLDPEVFEHMKPYFTDVFYNPGALYSGAVMAQNAIANSRTMVAHELSAQASEIVFTDGGTEANNLAIQGVIKAWKQKNPSLRPHVITTEIEHSSIKELVLFLEKDCDIDYLEADVNGNINIKELRALINERTVLVSVAYANGEIGSVEDIRAVSKTVRHYRKHNNSVLPYIHCDAVQAAQYLNLNVLQLGIDLITIAGSKIYGPKKIAALFVKKRTQIEPLLYGGDQELGLRPGTENVASVVGFAHALKRVRDASEEESKRLESLKSFFIEELKGISGLIVNTPKVSLPNIINVTAPELSSEEIVLRLDAKGIACSVRSACKSGEDGDSHVILAIRKNNEEQKKDTGSIRFSLGKGTGREDLEIAIQALKEIITQMRQTKKDLR